MWSPQAAQCHVSRVTQWPDVSISRDITTSQHQIADTRLTWPLIVMVIQIQIEGTRGFTNQLLIEKLIKGASKTTIWETRVIRHIQNKMEWTFLNSLILKYNRTYTNKLFGILKIEWTFIYSLLLKVERSFIPTNSDRLVTHLFSPATQCGVLRPCMEMDVIYGEGLSCSEG